MPPARLKRGRAGSGLTGKQCEDHLGAALIQPGGSRYEQMKWQKPSGGGSATRVEPREHKKHTSLAIEILQGTFFTL